MFEPIPSSGTGVSQRVKDGYYSSYMLKSDRKEDDGLSKQLNLHQLENDPEEDRQSIDTQLISDLNF